MGLGPATRAALAAKLASTPELEGLEEREGQERALNPHPQT